MKNPSGRHAGRQHHSVTSASDAKFNSTPSASHFGPLETFSYRQAKKATQEKRPPCQRFAPCTGRAAAPTRPLAAAAAAVVLACWGVRLFFNRFFNPPGRWHLQKGKKREEENRLVGRVISRRAEKRKKR